MGGRVIASPTTRGSGRSARPTTTSNAVSTTTASGHDKRAYVVRGGSRGGVDGRSGRGPGADGGCTGYRRAGSGRRRDRRRRGDWGRRGHRGRRRGRSRRHGSRDLRRWRDTRRWRDRGGRGHRRRRSRGCGGSGGCGRSRRRTLGHRPLDGGRTDGREPAPTGAPAPTPPPAGDLRPPTTAFATPLIAPGTAVQISADCGVIAWRPACCASRSSPSPAIAPPTTAARPPVLRLNTARNADRTPTATRPSPTQPRGVSSGDRPVTFTHPWTSQPLTSVVAATWYRPAPNLE